MQKISVERRQAIAKAAGLGDAYLYQIITKRKPAPVHLCTDIEIASNGELTREALRPDDWHRYWPELHGRFSASAAESAPCAINADREANHERSEPRHPMAGGTHLGADEVSL